MFLRDIMTCSFERLRSSDNLREAARLFRETHLEALPVADNQGRFAGIMTKANLFDALVKGVQPDVPIHGLFTTDVLMLNENMPYDEVKEIVRTSRAGNAVVINDCQEITGVLTKAGLIMSMLKQETKLNSELNAILQTMYNGLLVLDTNSTVVKLNRAAEKILSTTQDRAGGMRADSLLPGIKLDEVLIGGRPSVGYLYTGQDMSLLCNITPIAREGAITGAIIVFQDVTDLVRIIAELESVTKLYRTLQSVMDLAYDGIIVVDEQGLISMANQAAERFLRRNENHILGRPVEEVIENTMIMKVIRTGVPELNRLQFISGTPYVVSCLPIIRKGQVVGAVGKILFRNLDEIKDLARKLAHVDPEIAGSVRPEPKETETWHGFHQIVTADPAFRQIIDEAEIVSRGASNILITGESGTGKELIAQAIHHGSGYRTGPLVKVNCAAIPDSLMESEFFGYVPGAFTGASRAGKKGKLVMADGGTLFLDEIGDLPLRLQGKLLRVIQDKCFEPIGSNTPQKVDARFIAATNQDLEELVIQGRFRPDLFYRLNVIHLHIPPLRERRPDIDLLVQYFLDKYNRIFGTNVRNVSAEVREIFFDHDWPGNVRELENVIERGINFARGTDIERRDLPQYLREKACHTPAKVESPPGPHMLKSSREHHEREIVLSALEQARGNKTQAARLLGISRSWLYEKMKIMGISTGRHPF
ncbi:MAG: sigma 54-interacting transcriptional regulator [Deltaproteobacteria bacterium]|nr:sigma 54-interacting transcriptional regulator [Deltaproteobacteria bacterium]HPW68585.1 sigma 54-interacting transcriptional regulator [Deltaproteobacteria bacterium]